LPPFLEAIAMPDKLVSIDSGSHFGFNYNVNWILAYDAIRNRISGAHLLLKVHTQRDLRVSEEVAQDLL
jgi:hypothetical protein